MRNAVFASGIAHVALLIFLFLLRTSPHIIVPGPDVVQVSLLDPGALPVPVRPQAPAPKEEAATLAPEEEEGVKVAPPKPEKKPAKPKEEPMPAATPEPAAPALPYETVGSSGLRGQISVDAADFAFTYYLLLVRNRVSQNWAPPAGLTAGGRPVRAIVYFRITRGGRLAGFRVEESSGYEFFDRSAVRAIQLGDPMPPLPVGYAGSDLGVHFGFEFAAP